MNINKLALTKKIMLLLGIVVASALFYLGYLQLYGNIHVVVPNQVVRSAQLDPRQLKSVIGRYNIKAIIDLAPNNALHGQELALAKKLKVKHYDLGLKAMGPSQPGKLRQLIQLLLDTPRPVLIHCKSGSDRTGLASAIVLILDGKDNDLIKHQYSVWYGAINPHSTGRATLTAYFEWLAKQHLRSTKKNFLTWLKWLR